MRSIGIKITVVMLLVTVTLVVGTPLFAPIFIKRALLAQVKNTCEDCSLSIDHSALNLLPFEVTFDHVRFTAGNPLITRYEAHAARIVARISPSRLFVRELILQPLRLEGLEVTITEGDLPSTPTPDDGKAPPSAWTYSLDGAQISDAKFTYVRISGNGRATRRALLNLKNIQADIEGLGTIPALKAKIASAKLSGRLENSGEFRLAIATSLFTPGLSVDIDLRISDQNLADLNPYFEVNDGIKFTGSLQQSHASIAIREKNLKAEVAVKYLGLNLEFEKTPERGASETFFSNLAKSLKLDKSSIGETPKERTRTVELQRESKETLLHFIFRGLKDAALKVATS